jgi:hypothetical protein
MAVLDLFTFEEVDHGDHVHVYLDLLEDKQEELAQLVASAIAKRQTRGVEGLFEFWKHRLEGGPANPQQITEGLSHLIGLVVGVPSRPRTPDKVQAAIAEHLWYLLQEEQDDRLGQNELVQGPSLRVEDHGSDGLVVFTDRTGDFHFRLWEIKKRFPAGDLRPIVKRACDQISDSGYIYLAQAAETIQEQGHPDALRAFAARMASLWLSADRRTSAGVAIKAERGSRRDRSFDRMAEHLPDLEGAGRRLGLAIESGGFDQLADRVQELLWTGL